MKGDILWLFLLFGTGTSLWAFSADIDICSLVDLPMYCTCDVFGTNQAHTVSCFIFAAVSSNHSVWTGFKQQQRIRFLTITSRVNSSLTFIPTAALRMTPFLQKVVIHDGHLDTLWPYSFVNMTHLQNISLERNDINTIELFAFSFLPNLTELILSDNLIKRLPAEAFYRLPKMKILYIDRNNLSVIDDMAFVDLPSLEDLELKDNKIEQLTPKTFQGLRHLKSLDLCRNKLVRLVDDVFSGTPRLSDLDLHDNLLEDISEHAFRGLNHLNSLKLNSNRIKHLTNNVFKGTPNLMVVDFTRNRLQTFQKEILEPLLYSRKIQFIVFLRENELQCNCDILWISDYSEKSPSHLFRREVRHLKCRRNNTNVRISKLSPQELGCSLTTHFPTRVDIRPKQKSPKRSNSALRDTLINSTHLPSNETESKDMPEVLIEQKNQLSFEAPSTTTVGELKYSNQNNSRPYGAQVMHRDKNSSGSVMVARLTIICSIISGRIYLMF